MRSERATIVDEVIQESEADAVALVDDVAARLEVKAPKEFPDAEDVSAFLNPDLSGTALLDTQARLWEAFEDKSYEAAVQVVVDRKDALFPPAVADNELLSAVAAYTVVDSLFHVEEHTSGGAGAFVPRIVGAVSSGFGSVLMGLAALSLHEVLGAAAIPTSIAIFAIMSTPPIRTRYARLCGNRTVLRRALDVIAGGHPQYVFHRRVEPMIDAITTVFKEYVAAVNESEAFLETQDAAQMPGEARLLVKVVQSRLEVAWRIVAESISRHIDTFAMQKAAIVGDSHVMREAVMRTNFERNPPEPDPLALVLHYNVCWVLTRFSLYMSEHGFTSQNFSTDSHDHVQFISDVVGGPGAPLEEEGTWKAVVDEALMRAGVQTTSVPTLDDGRSKGLVYDNPVGALFEELNVVRDHLGLPQFEWRTDADESLLSHHVPIRGDTALFRTCKMDRKPVGSSRWRCEDMVKEEDVAEEFPGQASGSAIAKLWTALRSLRESSNVELEDRARQRVHEKRARERRLRENEQELASTRLLIREKERSDEDDRLRKMAADRDRAARAPVNRHFGLTAKLKLAMTRAMKHLFRRRDDRRRMGEWKRWQEEEELKYPDGRHRAATGADRLSEQDTRLGGGSPPAPTWLLVAVPIIAAAFGATA